MVEGKLKGPDPKKITPEALREAALRFLDVRDASVEQLRTTLKKRLLRYGEEEHRARDEAEVEALLERFVASKLIDDARFARGLSRSMAERGASRLKIQRKLSERGLDAPVVEEALASLLEEESLSEESRARTYAQKRRLAQKYDLSSYAERQKALSALCRQGFSFEVARRALDL